MQLDEAFVKRKLDRLNGRPPRGPQQGGRQSSIDSQVQVVLDSRCGACNRRLNGIARLRSEHHRRARSRARTRASSDADEAVDAGVRGRCWKRWQLSPGVAAK